MANDVPLDVGPIEFVKDSDRSFLFHVVDKNKQDIPLAQLKRNGSDNPVGPGEGRAAFSQRSLESLTSRTIKILAEGDSWIDILWPLSSVFGYSRTFVDLLDRDPRFDVTNIATPGDEFDQILRERQYEQLLRSGAFKVFIFGGGGNDFLGGGAFKDILLPFAGQTTPEKCLDIDKVDLAFAKIMRGYQRVARFTQSVSQKTKMLVHGYDYAVPRPNGSWLWEPLQQRGYDPGKALSRKIVVYLIDHFYDNLNGLAATQSNVAVIDFRNALGSNWADELHPNDTAALTLKSRTLEVLRQVGTLQPGVTS